MDNYFFCSFVMDLSTQSSDFLYECYLNKDIEDEARKCRVLKMLTLIPHFIHTIFFLGHLVVRLGAFFIAQREAREGVKWRIR